MQIEDTVTFSVLARGNFALYPLLSEALALSNDIIIVSTAPTNISFMRIRFGDIEAIAYQLGVGSQSKWMPQLFHGQASPLRHSYVPRDQKKYTQKLLNRRHGIY